MVAKTYVDALKLSKNSSFDAQRLIHWKDPSKITSNIAASDGGESSRAEQAISADSIRSGDFGSILEDVLSSRVQSAPSTATLGEVNSLLDSLAAAAAAEKVDIIRERILKRFSASEQANISFSSYQFSFPSIIYGMYTNRLLEMDNANRLSRP
jgi:hypothetical protein